MSAKIRKIAVNIEETHSEIGRKIDPPTRPILITSQRRSSCLRRSRASIWSRS